MSQGRVVVGSFGEDWVVTAQEKQNKVYVIIIQLQNSKNLHSEFYFLHKQVIPPRMSVLKYLSLWQ